MTRSEEIRTAILAMEGQGLESNVEMRISRLALMNEYEWLEGFEAARALWSKLAVIAPIPVYIPEYYCSECGEEISETDAQDEDKTHMIGDRYYHAECCPECKRYAEETK